MFEANKQKSAHFEIFLSTVHYDSLSFPQWFGRRSQTKDPHFIMVDASKALVGIIGKHSH